ncbi:MAG: sigma-54-dependent Fis family transcriptional regulator, partial [Spirochaetes bacterium]
MKILIVDDEKNVRVSIEKFLKLENFNCAGAENGLSAKRMIEQEVFSAAVVDLRMPGMDGLELIRWINEKGIRLPVIMISAHGEIQDAVEAMKLGAKDYIVKPFDPEELILRLKRVIEDQKLRVQVEVDRKDSADEGEIIGESSRMKEIKQLVKKVAVMPSTVLITGESGVGKEVIARAIHSNSPRSDGPFIGVNIGGIPETLI